MAYLKKSRLSTRTARFLAFSDTSNGVMATSSAGHSKFAPRTFTNSLSNLQDRAGYSGVTSSAQQVREAQRHERERERLEREGPSQLADLTEEQREEINEAVSSMPIPSPPSPSML